MTPSPPPTRPRARLTLAHGRALGVVAGVVAWLAATPVTPAAAQYASTPVIRSIQGFDPFGFGRPALNGAGAVAVTATDVNGTRFVYRIDGGTRTPIASTATAFARFGDVSINAAGQVGFEGTRRQTGPDPEGIFRGEGGPVTPIALTVPSGTFDFVNAAPSLNAAGDVAFIGALAAGFVDGVFVGDGGAVVPLYTDAGPVGSFNANPSLNDLGFVAFAGVRAGGPQGIFLGNGGPLTTLADTDDPVFDFNFFGQPALNEQNAAAFFALTNGGTESGIFLADAGGVTPILHGDFSQFFSFGFDASLNNAGQVAYVVEPTFGEQILAIGPDPVAGRVIGTGDLLGGRLVTGVVLWREGLNDAGQVAFTAFFEDGSAGVFLATPRAVPEPGTGVLVVSGVLALGAARRAARRRGR